MPKPSEYEQPVKWECWASRLKYYDGLGFEYSVRDVCNRSSDTDVGLCQSCYREIFGAWPPVSGKLRPRTNEQEAQQPLAL